MGYTNFTNGTQPALSDTVLNQMQIGLMELVFPIGSTYITQTDTNPATILKFGTWERLKGKVCLGLDEDDENFNAVGKTGGEKTHTLTIAEMPKHSHQIYGQNKTFGAGNYPAETVGNQYHNQYTEWVTENGQSLPHNNLQPYEVVGYMWIRRA